VDTGAVTGSAGYPALLTLAGRRVVVVGGGRVGARRARGLAESGAEVLVIAPVTELDSEGFAVRRRRYRTGDLAGAWFAVAATDDPAVNAQVAADAALALIHI
jgi:siroheme synthase-like protein